MEAEAQLVAEAAAEPGAGVGGSDAVATVASGLEAARKRAAAAADAPLGPQMDRKNRKHQCDAGRSRIGSRRLEPPKTIKQILNWPSRYMRLLPQEGLGIIATLFHEKGLAMSTNYSGIGMWETAVAYVGEALGGAQVTNFHACDIDEDCLRVLLQHQGLSKPQHVFENLENRWPTDVLRELRREETRFDDVLREESQSGMDSKSRRQEIGLQKLQAFARVLDSAQLKDTDFCLSHRRQCKLFDVDFQELHRKGGLVIHCGSPTCTDHSKQNQQRPGCAGKTGVAWACWLAERKHRAARGQEDLVMMEITPDHPSKDLLSEALPSHLLFTWLLDPTAFGVPNTRKRRYTVAVAPWLVAAMIEVPASVPAPLNTSVIDLVEDSRADCQELGHRATLQTIHSLSDPEDLFGAGRVAVHGGILVLSTTNSH